MTQRRIYQNNYPYHVTTHTKNNIWVFDNYQYAGLLHEIIINTCKMKRFYLFGFQIMPNHLHILIQSKTPAAQAAVPARAAAPAPGFNISQLLHGIKSYFHNQKKEKYGIEELFWQARFHDRIIRNQYYFWNAVKYINQNPTKEKLPEIFQKHPYQYFDWDLINNFY